jgi:hypothetical protein
MGTIAEQLAFFLDGFLTLAVDFREHFNSYRLSIQGICFVHIGIAPYTMRAL